MILIDYKDRRPIYEQIVARLKELILKGGLEADSQLPSVRNLAMELSINPNTIQRAYAELERQGFIYSVKGRGSFVLVDDRIRQEKEDEVMKAIASLIREARGIGITAEALVRHVKESYEEEITHD